LAAALAGLAVLAVGLWRVFQVRLAAGGEHPAYSTLNAAPTGARAVFDSFARLGRPEVARNVLPLSRFKGRAGNTLVLAGAGEVVFGPDTVENFELFESMMRDGLRVVIAFNPRSVPDSMVSNTAVANPWRDSFGQPPGGKAGPGSGGPGGAEDDEQEPSLVSAGERWGFQFEPKVNPERAPRDGYEVQPLEGGPPEAPRWFSVWRWAGLGPDWKPLAAVEGRPVIVRRAFGQGSLTLLSDTVFLSNEALWRAPKPGFLVWLLAAEPRLVFDETLHGTLSSPGVMHLVRQYKLLGFLAGAAALLALFVWRAGTSLVPVHPSVAEAADRPLTGAEGMSGFSNLLRQTIPPRQLLRTCFTEWARSPFVRRRVEARTVTAVRDLVAAAETTPRTSPVTTFRSVAALLAAARRGGAAGPPEAPGQ
jgi:hypothetical protein